LIVFGVALYSIQAQGTLNSLKEDLVISSNRITEALLRTNIVTIIGQGNQQNPPPPRPFNEFSGEEPFQSLQEREIVRVLDPYGNLVVSPFGRNEDALPLSNDSLNYLLLSETAYETATVSGVSMLIYNRPIEINDELAYIVQVARPLTERNRTLNSLASTFIITGGITILAAFGVGWLYSGFALRPIERITQTAQEIGEARDFNRRVEHVGKEDEVGQLANTFNQMLTSLEEAYLKVEHSLEQQRNFVSDVSHELRTPLTTLRGNLALLKHEPPIPYEEKEDILTDMVDESDRLIRLVNELLLLAHADAGRSLAKESFKIKPAIEEVVRQVMSLDTNRMINLAINSNLSIIGDRDALKQVVLILLDNAQKYSKGEIYIKAQSLGNRLQIQIQDKGPGIPANELEHIYERFYRPEENQTIPGFGLGLPIAKSLIEGMGGTIDVESKVHEGTTITIKFIYKNLEQN
jgi:signal transduction histidine kinase